LFNNSVRFTKQGTIRIDLLRERTRYRFQFFDTGCGIPQMEQENIFSLFEQGESNASAEGLGIGLALASNILNHFNSRLYVKSVEGKGTLFWFFIDVIFEENNAS
jgi:signal transduction histidine kinase